VATGPLPEGIAGELEALKLKLAGLAGPDLPSEQASLMAKEISGIRLQLRRLAFEHEALRAELERRALGGSDPG
jgi:hypothetical protein